jgi:hypothetical protein
VFFFLNYSIRLGDMTEKTSTTTLRGIIWNGDTGLNVPYTGVMIVHLQTRIPNEIIVCFAKPQKCYSAPFLKSSYIWLKRMHCIVKNANLGFFTGQQCILKFGLFRRSVEH